MRGTRLCGWETGDFAKGRTMGRRLERKFIVGESSEWVGRAIDLGCP